MPSSTVVTVRGQNGASAARQNSLSMPQPSLKEYPKWTWAELRAGRQIDAEFCRVGETNVFVSNSSSKDCQSTAGQFGLHQQN